MSDEDLYDLQLERITENELKEITQEELKVLAIKREMDSGYALTPRIIKKTTFLKRNSLLSARTLMNCRVSTLQQTGSATMYLIKHSEPL